jgi:hypothetical protein
MRDPLWSTYDTSVPLTNLGIVDPMALVMIVLGCVMSVTSRTTVRSLPSSFPSTRLVFDGADAGNWGTG